MTEIVSLHGEEEAGVDLLSEIGVETGIGGTVTETGTKMIGDAEMIETGVAAETEAEIVEEIPDGTQGETDLSFKRLLLGLLDQQVLCSLSYEYHFSVLVMKHLVHCVLIDGIRDER